VHCYRSRIFVPLFYSALVISVLASNRLDAASLQLSWVDNSDNEDGFHIERKVGNNGIFSFIAIIGPNVTSYTDDNLASNTTYCYRLNAFNNIGISAYTNEACGTTSSGASTPPSSPLVSSTIAATLLGQTGEDIAGTTSESPDGIQDVHIRLSGVQGTITQVRITDGSGGVWETPYNGWWIVAIRPHTDPSLVDLYFDFWQSSSSYTLDLTFANGIAQTIQTFASLPLQLFGNSP
jgi:hypothetical protein